MKTSILFASSQAGTTVSAFNRLLSVATFALAAGLVHAQVITSLPSSLTVYIGQTVTNAFSLTGWNGSNVAVSVAGPASSYLSVAAAVPSVGTETSRSLVTRGGSASPSTQPLYVIAAEQPAPVHTYTGTVSVTVRAQPTVAYSHTNGFHDGHIDQDSTTARVVVTRNAEATVLWGRHSNVALFPSTNIYPTAGTTFPLIPRSGQAGSDTFTIYATDSIGGWTNSIEVALTVVPVPIVRGLQTPVVFDEDTVGTNRFSVLYGGNTNLLSYSASVVPTNLIQNLTFIRQGGVSTNLTLVMQPFANANGDADVTVVVTDGTHTRSNTFDITVSAVPDPPSVLGLPTDIYINNTDDWTNAFASVSFSDPDDDRPNKEKLDVTVSDPLLHIVFADSSASTVSSLNTNLSNQTAWIRAVTLKAADGLFGVVGSTNNIPVSVVAYGRSDSLAITNTMVVHLHFKNTQPDFVVKVNPGQETIDELETLTPFTLESITDPDDSQVNFTLSVFLAPGYEGYGTLSKSMDGPLPPAGGVIGTGNRTWLDLRLRNTQFSAGEGLITSSTAPVYFIFMLSDGLDTTVKTNMLTLAQLRRPPVIYLGNGAPKDIYVTSDALSVKPYPLVYVTDPDESGSQPVKATLSLSPVIGEIDGVTKNGIKDLQSPAALSALLRAATFVPNPDALRNLAVGQSVSTRLTLTVLDETGLSAANNEVVIHIERVNAAPDLRVPEEQPVLYTPGTTIYPFGGVDLTSDDTNAVTFTFSIDDPAKGVFGNVDLSASGFALQGAGTYRITTADIGHILGLVTNITFTPSASYPFPPDDPFGTVFTLSAKDYLLMTTTKTLAMQVQAPPRNWLVTKVVNDGTPGSFQHALEHFSNNDVITFALPAYPATIRMPAAGPVIETGRALTIKGPGADLLTVSGDTDGNGAPDRTIFVVSSPVTIEGVTFANATSVAGGAFSVTANGKLTLRNVVIRDSVATQYGGAIDVFGGRLSVEGCAFLRNEVSDEGYGGGALSTYTDQDIGITNTLFDSNAQRSLNGAGGAIFAEFPDGSADDYALVDVVHCTFAENEDASVDYTASSVYACSGTHIHLFNTVLADDPTTRTLNLDSGAEIWSLGGNICDDSTYVPNQQQGGTSVYLLDPDFDLVSTDAKLAPLDAASSVVPYRLPLPDSPAIGFASPSPGTALDQRGRLRIPGAGAASGAVDPAAACWPAITEIQLCRESGDTDPFIEVFVPRNGRDTDLSGYTLYVNGEAVHAFGNGDLALTNSVYPALVPAAGISASYVIAPGRGVVVVFPKGPIADFTGFSPLNPTPVVRGSIVTNAADFGDLLSAQGRGSVAIARSLSDAPIVRHTFLTVYNDPDSASGTNRLDTAHNSIATAPQGRGFAFIPHSSASSEMLGGWRGRPVTVGSGILLQSPGATVDGTPFGLRNATPVAVGDAVVLTEDDVGSLNLLGNDLDADGNDKLVAVDVSTASQAGSGDAATALSALGASVSLVPADVPLRAATVTYDPRAAGSLQALPVGVEILDTFYYEVIDIGAAAVDAIEGGSDSNTWVTASNHRLTSGDAVVLSGSSVAAYNGAYAVTVLDDNTFAIPVPFSVAAAEPGFWEAAEPRVPSARSEAAVTVRVTGVNDAPAVAGDVVTNVTEASNVRIMVRPELAGAVLSLPGDPVPAPSANPAHLLDNDSDVDADETWQSLRLVGVMGAVHAIDGYAGTPGAAPVTVRAPSHGLSSGVDVLIANYGGHPSYNGYHRVTVIDADTFTIPRFFVDDDGDKGVWVVLNDDNRYHAVTDVGATVDLTLRADAREDHLIYNASASAFLNGLAEGELYTNRFFQAVSDSHGAIGIGPVDVIVIGLNDTPTARPDPAGVDVLSPLVSASNSLEQVLADGLDILYTLPPLSCATGRVDIMALDRSGGISGTLALRDFWQTDQATPILISGASLVANDSDIDRNDQGRLSVSAVAATSREGAALALASGTLTYDPRASLAIQRLARDERIIDTFAAEITDGMTGGTVTSLVAVLVTGLNDSPVAQPDAVTLSEDDVLSFNPIMHPVDNEALHDYDWDIDGALPDDRLTVIAVSNLLTAGEARVDLLTQLATYDATVSGLLNQLADWQVYTDSFDYVVSDNSFLFAVDDEFYVPSNTTARVLNVLANDRDLTPLAGALTIVEAGPTLAGGAVAVSPDGLSLVYSSPPGAACDDYFRYVVVNGAGNRRSARVLVRSVVPPLNGALMAANDRFVVAYGETAVLDVLANDNTKPLGASGLTLSTNVIASSVPGQPVASGNTFVFAATNGTAALTFTYEISAGGSSVAHADVRVEVVDRRGTLAVQDDAFSVEPGSAGNELGVLSNDNLITGSTAHLRIAELVGAAAHGMASVNAAATAIAYTPEPGFVGVEQLRYLATDGLGGTATGTVTVTVGRIDAVIDFFTVEAATNGTSVSLDVLSNDRVLPFATNALTVVSVSPASSSIGSLQVSGAGAALEFTPSNAVGQADFFYEVADGSGRTATGVVTVATVPPGIYANTDRFVVRAQGGGYVLDVLANDRSYPDVSKVYSLLSIGTGSEAPSAGGSVSIVSNRLSYTPAPGFTGQESFTYTMSDSAATDSAWVTVTVKAGDLFANRDSFAVFFEPEAGTNLARAFTLPVVRNDRIQPPLGQAVQISGLGAGANAPDHGGLVSVGEDGLTLVYRPSETPGPAYTERFTYEISDGTDRRASAVVEVRVSDRTGELEPYVQDDAFSVSRNSQHNALDLLGNDFEQPGAAAGWSVSAVSATAHGGNVSIGGVGVLYSPPENFVGVDTFSYTVSDGLGGTGSGQVRVRVGVLTTMPDLFVAVSGSASNAFDVVANDLLEDGYAEEYVVTNVFGASQGGVVCVSASNTVFYSPDPHYEGDYPYAETFFYEAKDDAEGAVTGCVRVVVHEQGSDRSTASVTVRVDGRNDRPVILNIATNLPITDKQTALPFLSVSLVEVDQQTLEPIDVVITLDDAAKGVLQNLGGFTDLGGGRYGAAGVTAAQATSQIRDMVFVPTENRIAVPTNETARFTITITDNKSEPVSDSQSAVVVTSVNDAPVIEGTRSAQTVYAGTAIRLFSSVTVREVDSLGLQPLDVTVQMSDPTHGALQVTGSFIALGGGLYRAQGITAAAATAQLRAMEFLYGTNKVSFGQPQLTVFTLTVSDRFAPAITDGNTSVIAYNAYEGKVEPTEALLRGSFGAAVDIGPEFAVVGAPGANVAGTDSGAALIYRLVPGTTNTWTAWRQLQPPEADASDRFGSAVAIEGDIIAVGAIRDETNGVASGAVYLFQRDQGGSNNWGQLKRIAPVNLASVSRFGYALDLDGDRLLVGAPQASLAGPTQGAGAAFLYGRNVGGVGAWGEIARRTPADSLSLNFGWSVSLSGDHLLVGAPDNTASVGTGDPKGAVYCYNRLSGGTNAWGLVQRLVMTNLTAAVGFGSSVSVDGGLMAVGAPKAAVGVASSGWVMLYESGAWSNGWSFVARLSETNLIGNMRFGYSLCVNRDFVFVGAPDLVQEISFGSAFLYRRDPYSNGVWRIVERFARPPDDLYPVQYGSAVSFKGNLAIVGAFDKAMEEFDYVSKAYIYRFRFNNAPALASPVPDQTAEWSQPFSYTLPPDVFTDPDIGDALAVQMAFASSSNGLVVDGTTVSGVPATITPVPLDVRATDASGASAFDAFTIFVMVNGVQLEPTPRNIWNVAHFGEQVSDPLLQSTVWGGLANGDGDALNNDQEYAFGGDPNSADQAGSLGIEALPSGHLRLVYRRRIGDPDLEYMIQGTPTLAPADWQDVAALVVEESAVPAGAGVEEVHLTLDVGGQGDRLFFRVLVTP